MVKVRWTERAVARLDEIYEYIAQDAPYYAERFIQQIIQSVDQIETFMLCGRAVPEAGRDDVREIIFQGYRIIYWVIDSETADILSVLHASRDLSNPDIQPWAMH